MEADNLVPNVRSEPRVAPRMEIGVPQKKYQGESKESPSRKAHGGLKKPLEGLVPPGEKIRHLFPRWGRELAPETPEKRPHDRFVFPGGGKNVLGGGQKYGLPPTKKISLGNTPPGIFLREETPGGGVPPPF